MGGRSLRWGWREEKAPESRPGTGLAPCARWRWESPARSEQSVGSLRQRGGDDEQLLFDVVRDKHRAMVKLSVQGNAPAGALGTLLASTCQHSFR